jgi:glycine/D-amino acid oxidase-like deaminating enzyme
MGIFLRLALTVAASHGALCFQSVPCLPSVRPAASDCRVCGGAPLHDGMGAFGTGTRVEMPCWHLPSRRAWAARGRGVVRQRIDARTTALGVRAAAFELEEDASYTDRVVICGGGNIGAALAYSLSIRGTPPLVIEPRGLTAADTNAQSEAASGRTSVRATQGEDAPQPSTYWEMNFRDSGLLLPQIAKDSALEEMAAIGFQCHQKLATSLVSDSPGGRERGREGGGRDGGSANTSSWSVTEHEYRRLSHLHLVTHNYQHQQLQQEMDVFLELCSSSSEAYDARIEEILLLPPTLQKRAPWLDPGLVFGAYGVHSQDEAAHVHPEKLRSRLLHAAVDLGAEVLQGSVLDVKLDAAANGRRRVTSLVVRRCSGAVPGAEGSGGGLVNIRANRVVFAMGAASAVLNAWLSLDLKILVTRTYGMLLRLAAPEPAQELENSSALGQQATPLCAGDLYRANLSALVQFPQRFCQDGLPLPAEALIVPRAGNLVWVGGLDEDVELDQTALPDLRLRPNFFPNRADRSVPRLQRTQEGQWKLETPERPGGAEAGAAPRVFGSKFLSDVEILGALRKTVSAVCPALASATIVAQVTTVAPGAAFRF